MRMNSKALLAAFLLLATPVAAQDIQNPRQGANPSATIGASAVNGTAQTFMRSDAAPALPATLPALDGSNLTNVNAATAPLAGITGLGTNVGSALAVNVGSSGAFAVETTGSGSIAIGNQTGFTAVGGNPTASYNYVQHGKLVTLTVRIQGVTSVASTSGTSYFAAAAFPAWTVAGTPALASCAPAVNASTGVSTDDGGSFNGNFFMSTFTATPYVMVQTCTFQVN